MQAEQPSFERLLQYLKESRGFDFTGYKRTSLIRRVQHQMSQVGVAEFDDYLDYLQVHPDEFTALFNTILINVTGFFRDPDAWQQLREEVIPNILRRKPAEPIRVWSAGCASGQEAYGVAMCISELMEPDEFRDRVKIYATDVDEEGLLQARAATYQEREIRGVPPDLLGKYFDQPGQRYVFRKDLRRTVIFGRNDLVQDAPISRIDLLVCRNTLMYFNAETQTRVLGRLHFALNPDGVLFLGKAEMLLSHPKLFQPIDLKRRFFRKASIAARERGLLLGTQPPNHLADPASGLDRLREEALLASPLAQLVLNQAGVIAMINQRASALLNLSERDIGRPFQDLEVSYRPVELRSSIEQAHRDRQPVWIRDVEWNRGLSDRLAFDIQLLPLLESPGDPIGVLISFHDVTRYRQLQDELENTNRQLESAYEELQSTNEELETTNEELQSTVEELETTNEELQSTNEELETMNEELQSMNDELHSTNDELRERTDEIARLNQFMQSILTSVRAGVIVVDRDMRVQVWNRTSEELWGLRQEEAVGEHLLNLDTGLPADEVKSLVRKVLADGESLDELTLRAVNRRGRAIELRVDADPLRNGTDGSSGVLLLMDVVG
ncbi:MAG: two-component system, chemotaxis family, CheB/CheR fusion protein [Mycobacteriales bacterium]